MLNKMCSVIAIVLCLVTCICAQDYDPDNYQPFISTLYFGANETLIDQQGNMLPGNNPLSTLPIQGTLIQLIKDGGDGIANPFDANGDPTADDTLLFETFIGIGINILFGEMGMFSVRCNFSNYSDQLYVRFFNNTTFLASTYYGQTNVVSINQLTGSFDRYLTVNELGFYQTSIPINPADDKLSIANAGGPYTAIEGSEIQFNALATTDPDDDLSSLIFSWDLDNDGAYDDATGITTTSIFEDNIVTYIRLKVTNSIGNASFAEASLSITNANPVVNDISDITVFKDNNFDVIISFIDQGINDTHTAKINWNDGIILENIAVIGNQVELSHQYSEIDVYTVQITIYDNDGGEGSSTFEVNVSPPPIRLNIGLVNGQINSGIKLFWDYEPQKQYEVWFCNSLIILGDSDWHKLAELSGNEYIDTGKINGFDNIPSTSDDCVHPSQVEARFYKIKEKQ